MYLPSPNDTNFTPAPAGTHLAVCVRVIDLGTQKSTFQGEAKMAHKVMLSWELPEELNDEGKPFFLTQRYTWSMSEKATLRKHLEAWRGAAFRDGDFGPGGFDIRNVLGKACVLTVTHADKDGKTYANVSSIGKPMRGMANPTPVNEPIYLWVHPERWSEEDFGKLSDNLRNLIAGSPEYHDLRAAQNGGMNGHDAHNMRDVADDDEIPF